jgi:Do/DeqQ family serine protease
MRRLWLIFSQAVTVTLAVVFVVGLLRPEWLGPIGLSGWTDAARRVLPAAWRVPPQEAAGAGAPVAYDVGARTTPQRGFAAAARRASPSVVSVVALATRRRAEERSDPQARPFFGDGEEAAAGMGSAVIVSRDGYLLTNFHVVEKADEIEVALVDGRRWRAVLVGSDPESDLAVLKIDVKDLPAISFGQADAMQIGDAVLAIGNPFNVGQTVTSGIVSAIGRSGLGLNTFENFIQTDAAINPGNSGGALVDVDGRLLGINTAIYSRTGGSTGIGFAIPVSTARLVLDGLVRDGVVTRGWIGVQPTDVTPDTAHSLQLSVDHGVLISAVLQDGPARRAGVRPGDVVLQVGDVTVGNTSQLLNAVAALRPNSKTDLTVQRGPESLKLAVTVGQRPTQRAVAGSGSGSGQRRQ